MSKTQLHKVITEAQNALNSVKPADTKPAPLVTATDLYRVKRKGHTSTPVVSAMDPELQALDARTQF